MNKLRDLVQFLFKPIKKLFFSGIPFFYGWFSLIRDEFLPLEWKEKLRLISIFNVISWYWWIIIGLFIWLIWTAFDAVNVRKDKSNRQYTKSEVKNTNQSIIVERDNLAPIIQYQEHKKDFGFQLPKQINIDFEPQDKLIDDQQYIVIVVTNKEAVKIFCRSEIRGIYDETDKNILRDISQFANHFSWYGGNTSKDGIKEILSGLDGTVNIGVIRPQDFGFYLLFHEDPNKNWQNPGKYKIKLEIKGKIGEVDFVGKKLNIELEYIKKEEHDGFGGFLNKGEFKLLNWKIEEKNNKRKNQNNYIA